MGLHIVPGMDSYYEPPDPPELPDGWWDEDTVDDVVQAVKDLGSEQLYEGGKMENGISVRFLARLTLLRLAARIIQPGDPLAVEAQAMFVNED